MTADGFAVASPNTALWDDVQRELHEAQKTSLSTSGTAEFLAQVGPLALSKECVRGHVTVACALLSADLERTLLVKHRKLGIWLQPGGHLEVGDHTLRSAASRESLEETGLMVVARNLVEVDVHGVPCTGELKVDHYDFRFAAKTERDTKEDVSLSIESTDIQWFSFDSLPDLYESTRRLLQNARLLLRDLG